MPIDVLKFEYLVLGSLVLLFLLSAINLKKLSTIKKYNNQIFEKLTENGLLDMPPTEKLLVFRTW